LVVPTAATLLGVGEVAIDLLQEIYAIIFNIVFELP
jgi:hypothetical protein